MATTSSNPTVTGTPISNSNNESPATLQRKLIVLTFNLPVILLLPHLLKIKLQ